MEFHFIWDVEPNSLNWIIGMIVIVILYGIGIYVFSRVVKRSTGYIFLGVTFVLLMLCYLFSLVFPLVLVGTITGAGLAVFLFANLGDLRTFIASPFKRQTVKAANFGVEKIYDRKALYKTIETAVINLSKTRTGAIITFEKNTSLKDIVKNGVPVNAPVSAELLTTIFYPGTRLHDGAVVIHGNTIAAASVFFTPTTKPFAGKYGSRHRAAIGISEISDAVTIVVSEETGRISFAINGALETCDQTSLLRCLENYMDGAEED